MQIITECQIAPDKVFFILFQQCSLSVKYNTQEIIVKCS
jgi:hypothetical protein